jgi:1-acyl-sn-glycerol-3-phosphate acyltransferase
MNRYREDVPYTFRPPCYSRFWAPLIYWLSDTVYLRRKYRVTEVAPPVGADPVAALYRAGTSLLLTPNHSDHSDPHVMMHWARRARVPLHFMAAREIFLVNHGVNGAVLQRAGVFSIDREGTDLRSIKEALRIVGDGRYPLVLFPEGEIFHLNERLTALNDGAATIALRAAAKTGRESPPRDVCVVPVALRYTYTEDVIPACTAVMDRLETWLGGGPAPAGHDLVARIHAFGTALLERKEREFLGRSLGGDLAARLEAFRELLIGEVEANYPGHDADAPHPERVRRARGRIRALLLGTPPPDAAARAACFRDLDRLYLAVQLYSYPGQYLREKPSPDRIAETVLKFQEDVFGVSRPMGRRKVETVFCPPLHASTFLGSSRGDAKSAASRLTHAMEEAIRSALQR